MKWLIIFLFPLSIFAQNKLGSGKLGPGFIGKQPDAPPVGGCTTVFYTNPNAQNDFSTIGNGITYAGVFGWDPGSSVNVCAFSIMMMLKSGVDYHASIWTTDVSNNLVTQLGSGEFSQTVTGDGTQQTTKWNFASSIALSGGNNYALVVSPVTGTYTGVGENIYQGGDVAIYSTGQWDSSKVLQGSSTRDPVFTVYQ